MKNITQTIICIEENKIYPSAKVAEEELGVFASNIRECCRGIRKTAGGYHWKDVDCIETFIPEGFVKIDNLDNYYVNTNGDIYSTHYHKILKQQTNKKGYKVVRIHNNKKKISLRIHQVVAKTFIPNPNGYKEINHKDEDKTNNCVENLEWCDRKYNMNYGTVKERIVNTRKQNKYITNT